MIRSHRFKKGYCTVQDTVRTVHRSIRCRYVTAGYTSNINLKRDSSMGRRYEKFAINVHMYIIDSSEYCSASSFRIKKCICRMFFAVLPGRRSRAHRPLHPYDFVPVCVRTTKWIYLAAATACCFRDLPSTSLTNSSTMDWPFSFHSFRF